MFTSVKWDPRCPASPCPHFTELTGNETRWVGSLLRVSLMSLVHPFPSILGMHIFGCKFSLRTDTGDTVPDRKNFDSLLWAIVTVFQVSGRCVPICAGEAMGQ